MTASVPSLLTAFALVGLDEVTAAQIQSHLKTVKPMDMAVAET